MVGYLHILLLPVAVVFFIIYSMSGSDGLVGIARSDKEELLYKHENKLQNTMKERLKLREMDTVEYYNSDPLPNGTFTWKADVMCGNRSDYCVPPLLNFETELRVVPKYKLSTCVVQKSMSTVMTAIFCFLFDEEGFRRNGRKLLEEIKISRFCANRNEARSMRSLRWQFDKTKEDGWTHTMVIRDPVDRFLSGFVDKCIKKHRSGEYCNGCKANMTCFVISEYERMVSQAKKPRFTRTFEDRHFFPQNWRCELAKYPNREFIRYSSNATDTLLVDLYAILSQKVENSTLNFIREELDSGRTPHSTVDSYSRNFLEERYDRPDSSSSKPLTFEFDIPNR